MTDVFISYRRKDVEFVKEVEAAFREAGREVWVDWEDIPPAITSFSDEIKQGIEGADSFVAVLSPDYLDSPYCVEMELGYALQLNKKIIPLVYRKFEGKESIVPERVQNINWVYFTPHAGQDNTFTDSFPKVLQALDVDYAHAKEHTRLLVRAKEWDSKSRSGSLLLRSQPLSEAEQWLVAGAEKVPYPTQLHQEYIHAGRQAAVAWTRNLLVAVSAALVVVAILAVIAVLESIRANRNAAESFSLELAANAQAAISSNDYGLGIALGLEAVQLDDPPSESGQTLAQAAYAPGTRQSYIGGHSDRIWDVAVSADGSRALSGGADGNLVLWDVASGDILATMTQPDDAVLSLAMNADGTQALTGSAGGVVTLWDLASGEALRSMNAEAGSVRAVGFSPDGTRAVSGHADNLVALWDLDTGEEAYRFTQHTSAVYGAAFSPDGDLIASADNGTPNEGNSVLLLWRPPEDPDGEAEIVAETHFEGQLERIQDLVFSPDGASLLLPMLDGTLRLWSVERQDVVRILRGHDAVVWDADFSPDGQLAISGAEDNTMRLWNVATGEEMLRFDGHTSPVNGVAFVPPTADTPPGSLRAISGSADLSLRLWDLTNGLERAQFFGHGTEVTGLVYDAANNRLLLGQTNGQIWVRDLDSNTVRTFRGHRASVTSISLTEDGRRAFSASVDSSLVYWDVETLETIETFGGHESVTISVAISPDGTRAVSTSFDGHVVVWDLEARAELAAYDVENLAVSNVAYASDGSSLLMGAFGGRLVLWDPASGAIIRELSAGGPDVYSVAYDVAHSRAATSSANNVITIYDTASGAVLHSIEAHSALVSNVRFSPDGGTLISGSSDGTVRLWDVAAGEELVRQYPGHGVEYVVFGPSGTVFMALDDRSIRQWAIEPPTLDELTAWTFANRAVPELTCAQRRDYRTDVQCDNDGIYPTRTPFAE